MQREWFVDQAKRRVSLRLILSEIVKVNKLQAKAGSGQGDRRGIGAELRASGRSGPLVLRPAAASVGIEGVAIEDNVVAWACRHQGCRKPIAFDELMGQKGLRRSQRATTQLRELA